MWLDYFQPKKNFLRINHSKSTEKLSVDEKTISRFIAGRGLGLDSKVLLKLVVLPSQAMAQVEQRTGLLIVSP